MLAAFRFTQLQYHCIVSLLKVSDHVNVFSFLRVIFIHKEKVNLASCHRSPCYWKHEAQVNSIPAE